MKYRSNLISKASGSLGGLVATATHGGPTFRAKTHAVHKKRNLNTVPGRNLTWYIDQWNNHIHPTAQAEYAKRAHRIHTVNAIGKLQTYTPFGLYFAEQKHWNKYGANAPQDQANKLTPPPFPAIDSATATASNQKINIQWSAPGGPPYNDNDLIGVGMYRPRSPGRVQRDGAWRRAGFATSFDFGTRLWPYNIAAPYFFKEGDNLILEWWMYRTTRYLTATIPLDIIASA